MNSQTYLLADVIVFMVTLELVENVLLDVQKLTKNGTDLNVFVKLITVTGTVSVHCAHKTQTQMLTEQLANAYHHHLPTILILLNVIYVQHTLEQA